MALGRKTRIFLLFLMVGMGVAVFYMEENWRGKRAWNLYVQQAQKEGAKFRFEDLVQTNIPPEENFAAQPAFLPLFAYRRTPANRDQREGEIVWKDSQAPSRANEWRLPSLNSFTNLSGNWQKQTETSLLGWQSYFRGSLPKISPNNKIEGVVKPPPGFHLPQEGQTPAKDVLFALKKFDPILAELQQTSQRKYSAYPIHYEEGELALLPHLQILRSLASILSLRASAHLKDENPKAALDDVLLILRLAESLENEPLFISQGVRFIILNQAVQPVWEGLNNHQFEESQLGLIKSSFGKFNPLKSYAKAFQGELLLSNWMADRLKAGDFIFFKYVAQEYFQVEEPGGLSCGEVSLKEKLYAKFLYLLPRGWIYQDQLIGNKLFHQHILPMADINQNRPLLENAEKVQLELEKVKRGFRPFFILKTHPWTRGLAIAGKHQNSLHMLRIACILEEFRIASGTYPETLDSLASLEPSGIPADVFGNSFHFEKTELGGYRLISFGGDGERDSTSKRQRARRDGVLWEIRRLKPGS